MKAIERLKASVSMKPTPRTVTLPNGDVFEFLSRPVTLAQRARAQKQAGNDSATDFALQLLVMLAEDENGQKLFDVGDIAELRNVIPASLAESLMLQLISEPDGEEEAFDPKSSSSSSKKTIS